METYPTAPLVFFVQDYVLPSKIGRLVSMLYERGPLHESWGFFWSLWELRYGQGHPPGERYLLLSYRFSPRNCQMTLLVSVKGRRLYGYIYFYSYMCYYDSEEKGGRLCCFRMWNWSFGIWTIPCGREPFTLSGGTYANRLPNAYVFGTNANLAPKDFPKGHGSAHGVDESVSLERLQRAMRIYARALLRLNELDW